MIIILVLQIGLQSLYMLSKVHISSSSSLASFVMAKNRNNLNGCQLIGWQWLAENENVISTQNQIILHFFSLGF